MNLYKINLNLLIALDTLLVEMSVTSAAKKLFITQSAMSNNLQQLRTLFNDDLLIRDKNRMILTGYAKELQPKLHLVLHELHSLIESGTRFNHATSKRMFTLGMSDYIASLLMPDLLIKLQKDAPNVKLSIVAINHLSTEQFEKGHFELGIGKAFDIVSSIKKQVLFKDKVVCIVNRQHPLARKKEISLQDYLSYKHVVIRSESPHYLPIIELELKKFGFERDFAMGIPFIIPIFKIIEESKLLIATIVYNIAKLYNNHHDFVVKELPFKIPEIEFTLAWHHKFSNDLGHQWLRQHILDLCKNLN